MRRHHARRRALRRRREEHHAADEGGRGASRLESPASRDPDAVLLLRDLDPRLIAPGGAGARVREELLAESGLGGRVDQSRADAGMGRDPARRGVGLRERHDDLQPLGQRRPQALDIGRNQDLEDAGALEPVGEIGRQAASRLEFRGARAGFGRQLGQRGPQVGEGRDRVHASRSFPGRGCLALGALAPEADMLAGAAGSVTTAR